jgi:hypothetical protein
MENQSIIQDKDRYNIFGYSVSLAVHVLIVLICIIILNHGGSSITGKGIDVQLTGEYDLNAASTQQVKLPSDVKPEPENIPANNRHLIKNQIEERINTETSSTTLKENKSEKVEPILPSGYYNFAGAGTDATGLVQVYSENSLNVKINYPLGWTFVDQDRQKRLDGVTFWANNGIFNPPPYIFLEVKEKYLFNESRYKYNTKLKNTIAYYNDPEELEGQVSQVFYIRTDTDEDFSLKLIMNGKDTFIAFQPIFFGMIKSFNFGSSLF